MEVNRQLALPPSMAQVETYNVYQWLCVLYSVKVYASMCVHIMMYTSMHRSTHGVNRHTHGVHRHTHVYTACMHNYAGVHIPVFFSSYSALQGYCNLLNNRWPHHCVDRGCQGGVVWPLIPHHVCPLQTLLSICHAVRDCSVRKQNPAVICYLPRTLAFSSTN